jgi:hypothetical protein
MLKRLLNVSILFFILGTNTVAFAEGSGPARELDELSREEPSSPTTKSLDLAPDGNYHVYRLPEGVVWSEDGAEDENGDVVVNSYMCYDLDGFKLLLHMDNDLRAAELQLPVLKLELSSLYIANKELQEALAEAEKQLDEVSKDRERISEQWKKDNLAKHKAENRPVFPSAVPWIISGVLAMALAGTIVGVVASN